MSKREQSGPTRVYSRRAEMRRAEITGEPMRTTPDTKPEPMATSFTVEDPAPRKRAATTASATNATNSTADATASKAASKAATSTTRRRA